MPVVGAVRLRQGAVDVSAVVFAAFLFTVLAVPVRTIGFVLTELPRSVVGWERVRTVLTATGEMPYGPSATTRATGPAALRLCGVGYAYTDGAPILTDVSFEVPPGRTVALVGSTGSGKSTVASLAVRLVDPECGTVEMDGTDVRELSASALAATAALVPQIPFLFDDTVRGNVTLDRPGDDAGRRRHARPSRRLCRPLPSGADTMVGERGTTLSGGSASGSPWPGLAGSPRLPPDDATSAVDPRVEAAILSGLRRSGCPISSPPTGGDDRARRRGVHSRTRAGGRAGSARGAAQPVEGRRTRSGRMRSGQRARRRAGPRSG